MLQLYLDFRKTPEFLVVNNEKCLVMPMFCITLLGYPALIAGDEESEKERKLALDKPTCNIRNTRIKLISGTPSNFT